MNERRGAVHSIRIGYLHSDVVSIVVEHIHQLSKDGQLEANVELDTKGDLTPDDEDGQDS